MMLQWGRRFSSAEIQEIARSIGRRLWASMGPPIFIGGNVSQIEADIAQAEALQWGRRFSSAEIEDAGKRPCRASSFNGAADFHRRKSETMNRNAETNLTFNGAADFHRRKCRGTGRGDPRRPGFNGAADFHRRKSQVAGSSSRCGTPL